MPGPASPAALAELTSAVAASRADAAAESAVTLLAGRTAPIDVIRAAVLGAAALVDTSRGDALHALLACGAAANTGRFADTKTQGLATVQAVHFLATAPKLAEPPAPPRVVAGEVTHLGRSALFAARRGDVAEAEAIFLGIVEEGWERKMAGDMLFRAALEDRGDRGHKLLAAVTMWQLCQALSFRDARTVLRPAVRYLVKGERDPSAYEGMLAILGREWVDLDSLMAQSKPLDDAARGTLSTVLASPTDEACVTGTLALLNEGFSPHALMDRIVVEAARRVLTAADYDLNAAHALLDAHAARYVIDFSRSSERLYAVFQAALRVRSPAPRPPPAMESDVPGEEEGLSALGEDLAGRRPAVAAARVRAYLSGGFSGGRLMERLARHACMDSFVVNQGHNLALAEACTSEYRATKATEIPMALAAFVAASPRGTAAADRWAARLGP